MIILELLLIILVIEWTAKKASFQIIYNILPPIFWIYFTPMILSNLNFIPSQHAVYDFAVNVLLPMSLLLMLINAKLSLIRKLGKASLILMFTGTLGVLIGTPIAVFIFKPFIRPEILPAFGTLAASWMGGTFNMIAVKEATGIPDSAFSPLIIVDTLIGYSWMGFLIFLSHVEKHSPNKKTLALEYDLAAETYYVKKTDSAFLRHISTGLILLMSYFLALGLTALSKHIPEIPGVLTSYAWIILIVTTLSLCLSIFLAQKDYTVVASKVGQYLLYFILATIGAKAKLAGLQETFLFVLVGLVILAIHAGILFAMVKFLRLPLALFATASQANIGGVVSAPIVASVYHPSLAPVALLMAIIGNIIGTYLGIVAVALCRWVVSL
jgi:uncharacterized membrane protein